MGIGSKIKDAKRIFSQDGSFEAVNSRISNLETHEYKITYYEVVSGTSGTLTVPSQGTINADEFGLSGNAILSKIDVNGKPTFESPVTSGGSPVTASLNVLTGAWVASAAYTDSNVALIYSIKINALYYDNLVYNNIIETVRVTADVGTTTLQSVTDAGNTTTNTIETAGYVKTGGTSSQFLKADGSVDSSVYITSSALTPYLTTASAALTYYPLTNPSAYISGITSGMVTTALGFTPYNATNPSGFITSSALTPYLTINDAALTYFPIPTGTTSQYVRGDGTLASFPTIPSITGLVPYTGATGDVDLGTYDLYTTKLWLYDEVNSNYGSTHYTDGNYHIEDADGHKLFVIEDGFMQLHKTDTIQSNLYTSNLTAIRDHYLPDASGTIALTSNIGSWGALNYPTWVSGTPFVKMTAAGTFALDTNTYLTTSSAATTYVPYTGATGNVDLGTYTIKVGNGTASATAIQLGATANLGLYSSSANKIDFVTQGVTRMSINADGTVVMGNASTNVIGNTFLDYATNTTGIRFTPTALNLSVTSINCLNIIGPSTTGNTTSFNVTKPNNTNQTATFSISGWNFNGGTRQWATGNIGTQNENVWGGVTYSFVGASTITNAYGNVFNAATAGTNATITNNYAAQFNGKVEANLGLETNTLAGLNTSGGNLLIISTNNATKGSITIGNNNAELVYLGNQQFAFTNVFLYGASNANSFLITRVTASDTAPVYVTNRADTTTGIGGALNKVALIANGLTRFSVNGVTTSGATNSFTLTKPDNTNQTLSTSIAGWNYNGGTRQWATGAIGTQLENIWGATTYSFVGASTITNAYGNVFNAPIAGTNATITNNYAARFNGAIYSDSTNSSIFDNSAGSNFLRVRRTGGTIEAIIAATGSGAFIGSSTAHSLNIQSAGVVRMSFAGVGNGDCTFADGMKWICGSTLGNTFGSASTQKLAFWNATPIVQPANTVSLNAVLENTGLMASGSTISTINKPLVVGANTTPRTGVATDGVTSVLGNLQNFTTNYHSGEVLYSEVSGEALNFGQLCYRNAAGKWQKATGSSSAIAAYNMLGICLHTVAGIDTAISILTRGYVESTYLSAGAVGSPLFMDATTAGSITDTAPSTAGNIVRIIGNVFWSSATQTNSKWIVYFNPDNTWIEL